MTTLGNAEKLAPMQMAIAPEGKTNEIKDSFWEATKTFIKYSALFFAVGCVVDKLFLAVNKPQRVIGLKDGAFYSAIFGALEGVHKFNNTTRNNDRAAVLNKHKDTPLIQTEIDLTTTPHNLSNNLSVPLSTTDKIFGSAALAGLAGACAEAFIPKLKLSKTLINTCVGSIGLGGIGYIGSRIHSTSQALQAEREKLSNAEKP